MGENQKKYNIKSQKRQIFLSTFMLIVSVMLLCTAVFAWYAGNKDVSANSFELSTDSSNVRLTDTFTITRMTYDDIPYYTYTYKKDTDGIFYEYDTATQAFVLDDGGNKKGVHIGGLLPNEYLVFEITFERYGKVVNMNYNIVMLGIWGETIEGTDCTVLGVYRVNVMDEYDNLSADIWLDDYDDGAQPATQQIMVENAYWPSTDTTVTLRFRMTLDTTQLTQLQLATTNLLSEKGIAISGIRLIVTDIE
ncbi:MAG TPA: hypothetical protein PK675_00305 [Clostridia bacterium]|nr:hypothetical protein [Clostridia bacterium]